jgi:phosphoribosyl-ATP pyrophosphohydrolase
MSDAVDHLYDSVLALRGASPGRSRTAKLFREGMPKMAKKVAEEAAEVALDAVQGNRSAVVLESADLLYNLCVLWAGAGITPAEVWAELARREKMMGVAEKLPKGSGALTASAA